MHDTATIISQRMLSYKGLELYKCCIDMRYMVTFTDLTERKD